MLKTSHHVLKELNILMSKWNKGTKFRSNLEVNPTTCYLIAWKSMRRLSDLIWGCWLLGCPLGSVGLFCGYG